MAQLFKSKVFWVVLITLISLSAIGVTFGVLLTSNNKVNTNLNQSTNAYTYTNSYGTWTYTVSDTNATITKYSGTAADVVIPSKFNKNGTIYTVTELYNPSSGSYNQGVFYSNSSIQRVTIPSTITSIGNYAFMYCYKLLEVINKSSLTITAGSISVSGTSNYDYVGYYAKQIITDESQSKYQVIDNVRYYIDSSKNYYIAVGIENSPTSITINNSCTKINAEAFYQCTGLTSVTIGNSVTSIGENAFCECTGLTDLYYTGSISQWCKIDYLGSSYYNASPLYYAHNLYIDNQLVTNLVIPNTVTYIRDYAFCGCSLTSVTIGNSVTSIGSYAFYSCTSLTSAYFLRDYSSGIGLSVSGYHYASDSYIGKGVFNSGNNNVTYYFINQASRDNIYNINYRNYVTYTRSSFFTDSNFEVMTPQFNIEVNNNDWGSVSGNVNPDLNTSTTLTAIPNIGCGFKYWLKNGKIFTDNTNNPLTVEYTEYVMYTAVFGIYYTIITNISNNEYGTVTNGDTYINDTEVTLTATPNTGYRFVKWLKNNEEFDGNTENPLTIQVTSNDTYTAVITGYFVVVDNITPTTGTATGGGEYVLNTQVTLTATPNSGARFFYWLKNGQTFAGSLSNPLTITVTEDATYAVCFAPEDYNPQIRSPNSVILEYEYQGAETVNPEVCGRLTTYCYGDFDNKTKIRVESIATSGYRFVGWKINGESTISAKYTSNKADILLTDIPNSKIIIAVFDKST